MLLWRRLAPPTALEVEVAALALRRLAWEEMPSKQLLKASVVAKLPPRNKWVSVQMLRALGNDFHFG